MSDRTARSIGDDALVLLAKGLRPLVEERLRDSHGDTWRRRLGFESSGGIGSTVRSLDDPAELLGLLHDRDLWDQSFRPGLASGSEPLVARAAISVLRDLRNDLYHHHPFGITEAWRAVDGVRQLLRAVARLDDDARDALDRLEVEAGLLAAAGRLPDLDRLRAEYAESILAQTTFLEVSGISPSVGSRVVRVRAGDVYVPPRLNLRERPPTRGHGRATAAASAAELLSMSWEQRRALRLRERAGLEREKDQLIARILQDAGWFDPTEPVASREAQPDEGHTHALSHVRAAIIGAPGSGKTSYLRHVARGAVLGSLEAVAGRTPVIVRIPVLAAALAAEPDLGLRRYLVHRHSERFGELIGLDLELGRALVLIDGADEVASAAQRSAVLAAIARFCADYPSVQVVVTSRPVGFRPSALGVGFAILDIEPFDDEEVARFCRRWMGVLTEDGGAEAADDLVKEIGRIAGVRELASSPLLLTIIVLLWERGTRLPDKRIDLYAAATSTLLRDWPLRRLGESLDAPLLLSLLEPIGHDLVVSGQESIGEHDLIARLTAALAADRGSAEDSSRDRARTLVEMIGSHTGFFIEAGSVAGERRFGFIHRTFAEYLAARHLAEQWATGELDLTRYLYRPELAETVSLLFAHVATFGPAQASRLVRHLIDMDWPAERSVHRNLRLAARLLAEGVRVRPETRDEIARRLASAAMETGDASMRRALATSLRQLARSVGALAALPVLAAGVGGADEDEAWRAVLALSCDPESPEPLATAVRACLATAAPDGVEWSVVLATLGGETWGEPAAFLVQGSESRKLTDDACRRLSDVGVPRVGAAEIADGSTAAMSAAFLVGTDAPDLSVGALVAVTARLGADVARWLDPGEGWDHAHAREIDALADDPSDLPPEMAPFALASIPAVGSGPGLEAWARVWRAMRTGEVAESRIAALKAAVQSWSDSIGYPAAEIYEKAAEVAIEHAMGDEMPGVRLALVGVAAAETNLQDYFADILTEIAEADRDPTVRTAARRARLVVAPSPSALHALLADESGHQPVEIEAGGIDLSDRIVEALLDLEEELDPSEWPAVRRFVGRLAAVSPAPELPLGVMAEEARPDPPSLGETGRDLLRSDSPVMRAWGTFIIASVLRGERRAELAGLLTDVDPTVRVLAANAIHPVDVRDCTWLRDTLPRVLGEGPRDAAVSLAAVVRDRASVEDKRDLLEFAEIHLAEHPRDPVGIGFVDTLLM